MRHPFPSPFPSTPTNAIFAVAAGTARSRGIWQVSTTLLEYINIYIYIYILYIYIYSDLADAGVVGGDLAGQHDAAVQVEVVRHHLPSRVPSRGPAHTATRMSDSDERLG